MNYKLPEHAGKSPSIISVDTPDVVKQALSHFKEVGVASEQVVYTDDTASHYTPTDTGAIVTTEDGVKSAVMISFSPQYENLHVSFIPCNIPVAFSAKEALEIPYAADPITVPFGDDVVDRLRDAIQQSCADAHAFYLDGLLDLDDQLEL